MKKRYIAILITLGFLCLGTLILSLIFKDNIKNFFDYTLLDCVNIVSTLIIGFVFTYTISVSLQAESKKNEIFQECLSSASENARKIIIYLEENSNKTITNEIRMHILTMFQVLSADIATYIKLCPNKNQLTAVQNELLQKRKDFNNFLTGDALAINKLITEKYLYKNIKAFYNLQNCIFKCKLELNN